MSEGRTSAAWYLLALLPVVIGGALTAHFGFGFKDGIVGMKRIEVPGEADVELGAGEYTIYGESVSHIGDKDYFNPQFSVQCSVTRVETGDLMTLTHPSGTANYAMFDYVGEQMWEIDLPKAGTYHFSCAGEDDPAVLAIGRGAFRAMVFAIISGIVAIGAMAVIILVVALKRGVRRKK
jgi:hypothetical protein